MIALKKLRVGVLMGGSSPERAVSLVTGRAVYDNLDRKKYTPVLIEMDVVGRFWMTDEPKKKMLLNLQNEDRQKIDLMFIALHGGAGEDGSVQGLLETFHIPYTGSKVLASSLAMEKVRAMELYAASGLKVPAWVQITRDEWKKNTNQILVEVQKKIGWPVVVKPADQGSAVGVFMADTKQELSAAITRCCAEFEHILIQKRIVGPEATCGVLEKNGVPFALPPTHITANLGEFYDYDSKYKPGGSTHVCPADFSQTINKKIQSYAVAAHQLLGCRGMSRTDFMIDEQKNIFILETNTIPGMTPTSLLPEAAQAHGISFSAMLDLIITTSR